MTTDTTPKDADRAALAAEARFKLERAVSSARDAAKFFTGEPERDEARQWFSEAVEAINALASLPSDTTVEAEWKLVPATPTPEMLRAAADCQDADPEDGYESELYYAYLAMLAASPPPPAVEAQELPPLPKPISRDDTEHDVGYFTAEDMRLYAQIAVRAAQRPASDADIAEHMRLVVEYAGLHFLATRTGDPTASKAARAAVEASARRLAKGR